jgi:ABC-type metal ion transport system, periplasmic component/surface adhesin
LGSEKLKVFVTIPPQKYFVERIGKERVQVQTLIPAGSDVHTYEPRPNQMKALQQSKIYFSIGDLSAFEESQLPKIAKLNPNLKIIDTSLGIKRLETTEPLMTIGKNGGARG